MRDPRSDATLVAEAANGSEHAFAALYRAYVRPVYWIAHGLVGSTDAEDVTQETFVVAWRKLPGMQLAGESLLPWLATICRFQCANRVRAQRRDREHTAAAADESLPSTVDVEQQVIGDALADRILHEIGELSEIDRSIFRLCTVEGYAYEAAASELGVTHAVVRNRLSRIRTRLRNAVEETS
ncbi:RNA polymerase sigma factor [Microbacterium koreense]|uniref:RNA polymerase sigma factor n=1 Tax=Microbacterium koreense TaxID=323761 RepID=A0ABW2ZRN0_9MICO